jgi:hypothetical protein
MFSRIRSCVCRWPLAIPVALIMLAAVALPAETLKCTVSGRVIEAKTRAPIPDAKVILARTPQGFAGSISGLTGPDGRYRIEYSGEVSFHLFVVVQRKGYVLLRRSYDQPVDMTVEMRPDTPEINLDIELEKAVPIRGMVVNEAGTGLGAARVSLAFANDRRAFHEDPVETGADGSFQIEAPPNATLHVRAEPQGIPAQFSDPLDVRTDPIESVRIVCPPAATLVGQITDPTGEPVSGATVYVSRKTGRPGQEIPELLRQVESVAEGKFVAHGLPQGSVEVSATRAGQAESPRVPVKLDKPVCSVELSFSKRHRITGRVVTPGGEPIPNAELNAEPMVRGSILTARTDASGRFTFDRCIDSPYRVSVTSHGDAVKHDVPVDGSDVVFEMKPRAAYRNVPDGPPPRPGITCTVVDAATKSPISDYSVMCPSGYAILKDPTTTGTFRVNAIGSINLTISAPGYAALRHSLNADGGRVTLELWRGTKLRGRAMNKATGQPVPDVTVEASLSPSGGAHPITQPAPIASTKSGADGTFQLDNLATDTRCLVLRAPDGAWARMLELDLRADSATDLGDIDMAKGCVLRGTVVRESDQSPWPECRSRSRTRRWGSAGR